VCRQQRPKGFAFLEFDNPSAASTAIQQMNGFQLMGRTIKVLPAGVLVTHCCCVFGSGGV
jgi:RNA recognition motif-containing protein